VRTCSYDENGNLKEEKLQIGDTLWDKNSWQYDLSDRKTEATENAGAKTRYEYDPSGNVVKITNPDGYHLSFTYDAANRAVKANDPEGNTVGTVRDVNGKPKSLTDPNGNATKYTYWGKSRNGVLKRKTLPVVTGFSQGRAVEYDYDANGNVISEGRIAGDQTELQPALKTYRAYDELSRLVRVAGEVYTDPTLGEIRPVTRYTYNLMGFLTQIEAGHTDLTGVNFASDVVTPRMSYAYDDFGRKLKETDPLGNTTLFAYDVNNNITRLTDAKNQETSFTWGYGHQLLTRSNPAGNVTFTRNPLGQPTRAETLAAGNASLLVAYDTTYDLAHRPETITDSRHPQLSLTYGFSLGGRLKSVQDGRATTQPTISMTRRTG
jgi:YD repeat-containing protein